MADRTSRPRRRAAFTLVEVLASLLMALLYLGGESAQIALQLPKAISQVFQGLLLMFLLVFLQWGILGNRSYQTITGKGYSPGIIKLGKWRWLTFAICVLFFLLAVALPFAQLLVGSFFRLFGFYSWDMLTLEHYEWVFENRQVWRAIYNTMLLGVLGASATMVLGGMVAYVSEIGRAHV